MGTQLVKYEMCNLYFPAVILFHHFSSVNYCRPTSAHLGSDSIRRVWQAASRAPNSRPPTTQVCRSSSIQKSSRVVYHLLWARPWRMPLFTKYESPYFLVTVLSWLIARMPCVAVCIILLLRLHNIKFVKWISQELSAYCSKVKLRNCFFPRE